MHESEQRGTRSVLDNAPSVNGRLSLEKIGAERVKFRADAALRRQLSIARAPRLVAVAFFAFGI